MSNNIQTREQTKSAFIPTMTPKQLRNRDLKKRVRPQRASRKVVLTENAKLAQNAPLAQTAMANNLPPLYPNAVTLIKTAVSVFIAATMINMDLNPIVAVAAALVAVSAAGAVVDKTVRANAAERKLIAASKRRSLPKKSKPLPQQKS